MRLFVTGNGTDVGKTVVSAILVQALGADYWKPVQAGGLENTDTDIVKSLVSSSRSTFHVEKFLLKKPMSPHAAAAHDGVEIELKNIALPDTLNDLVIEGAGGVLVPLNNNEMVVDMIAAFEARAIVVSRNYLGSINHTLLTVEALVRRGISVAGIVFNGERNEESERIIERLSGVPVVGRVPEFTPSRDAVSQLADELHLSAICGDTSETLIC